ncbi:MAG TPA: hypothetical protein VLB11_04705 [Methyloceanibacter sp.]|nr:hypothetical protein [Methyloceanibacter sp.]
MKTLPLLLAALTLSISAGPVFALKNIEGCDIVAFAPGSSALTPEQWLDYRSKVEAALMPGNAAPTAAGVVAAQKELLALIKASPAYRDYLAGDSCRILAGLDAGAVQKLLAEAAATMPADAAKTLGALVETARAQIDRIERTARFRSNRDRTLFAAQYYCFVAASIVAFLPPERRAEIALEDFGDTISCKDAGRTG